MGFKWFGKLVGGTNASSTMAASAPSNTLTPFVAQPAGTKMLAYGEGSSSVSFNRIAAALQENIEQLAGVLDSPALADTRIMAADTVSYGSEGLADVAASATYVDLAALTAGNTAPVTWIYTGLHKDRLGDFIRLYRQSATTQAGQQEYDSLNPTAAAEMGVVVPTDVKAHVGATSIFRDPVTGTTQAYLEAVVDFKSPHSLAKFIPPIKAITTALAPYSGVVLVPLPLVQAWYNDGLTLDITYSWRDLYMKPGCFVHVKLGGVNNGLYRIAHLTHNHAIAADKAVLTRGGLHAVSVTNAAVFNAGRLLCWSSYPLHTNAGLPLNDKENFAYCVFVDATENVIYLAELGCEEDFPTFASGNINGQKVDSTTGTRGTASAMGDVGQIDFETGAGSSISLRVGTLLYDADNILVVQEVLAVIPAHYPVKFDTAVAAGATVTPCNPLGFILNPRIDATAGDITGGSYIVHCKTLTTAREKLTSYGANGRWQIVADPSDKLDSSAFEAGQIRAFARYLKTGDEAASTRVMGMSEYPSGPFSATSTLLGDNLWQVTLDVPLVVASGTPLSIFLPTFSNSVVATVVHCDGTTLTLRDVSMAYLDSDWIKVTRDTVPIAVGSTFTSGGVKTITAIVHAPLLRNFTGTASYAFQGLQGAYLNSLSATKLSRQVAGGAPFVLEPSAPIDIYRRDAVTAATESIRIRADTLLAFPLLRMENVNVANSYAQISVVDGGTGKSTLAFKDSYATTLIPFADATYTTLPGATGSILSAIAQSSLFGKRTLGGDLLLTRHATNVSDAATRIFVYPGGGSKSTHAGFEANRVFFDPILGTLFAGRSAGTKADALGANSAVFGYECESDKDYTHLSGYRNKTEHVGGAAHGAFAGTHIDFEQAYSGNIREKDTTIHSVLREVVGVGVGVAGQTVTTYLYKNVDATTVTVVWDTHGAGVVSVVDDGVGNIVGLGLTGTINYVTGALSLVFGAGGNAVQVGTEILVAYYTPDTSSTVAGLAGENVIHLTASSIPNTRAILAPQNHTTHSMEVCARGTYFITGNITGRPIDVGYAGLNKRGTTFKFEAVLRTESRCETAALEYAPPIEIEILAHEGLLVALPGGAPVVRADAVDFSPWPANDLTGCVAHILLVAPAAGTPGGPDGSTGQLILKVGDVSGVGAAYYSWSAVLRYTYVSTQEQRYPGEGYS